MAKGNYLSLYYHLVFSTKNRQLLLYPEMQNRLYAYIRGFAENKNVSVINVNGMRDHIHILFVVYSGDFSLSTFVRELKKCTNEFLNETLNFDGIFSWQTGYYTSTVSPRDVKLVKEYITNQEIHHKGMSFDEELAIMMRNNPES